MARAGRGLSQILDSDRGRRSRQGAPAGPALTLAGSITGGRAQAILACLIGAIASVVLSIPAATAGEMPAYVPGRLLVRFKGESEAGRQLRAASSAAGIHAGTAAPDLLPGEWLIAPRRNRAESPLRETIRVVLPPGDDVLEAAARWSSRPDVAWASPIRLIPLLQTAVAPNDPSYPDQWHHAAIGSEVAWNLSSSSSDVVIAVIDTGIDLEHDDLKGTLWQNAAELAGVAGVDDDGNGYVDDIHGYDFTDVPEIDGAGDFRDRDPEPMDDVGHGTWVTGAATAVANNALGGAGVAFGARCMGLRAGFRPRNGLSLGYLAEDDAAAAIFYAVDNGATVLNLSFGDLVRAPILDEAVRFAVGQGAIVVAAAGNAGTSAPFYPAALDGVLAVGAHDRALRRASFSTSGNAVGLLAPGVAILTTELGGGVTSKAGTSLAAPIVAGAAAILKSLRPEWSAARIRSALLDTSREAPEGADARGARLLDLGAAVTGDGEVVIDVTGLADGDAFDRRLVISGRVDGPAVRGWRVLLLREGQSEWRFIGGSSRRTAYQTTLAEWDLTGEPEGRITLRVEALGVDRVLRARQFSLSVDHTPPVVTLVDTLPVVSGNGFGVRVLAETDDPALGSLTLETPDGPATMAEIVATRFHVLGLNGPLDEALTSIPFRLVHTNLAGLTTESVGTMTPPPPPRPTPVLRSSDAPGLISLLPGRADFNGDGRPELVGELPPAGGQTYGNVVLYEETPPGEGTDPFSLVWDTGQSFLPLGSADFDADGRLDLLGLALQEIRVYSPGPNSRFPARLQWRSTEAWAAGFIPSPDNRGFDIVASRDDELRIFRRQDNGLVVRQALQNPTTGGNGISPQVAAGVFEAGGRFCLVTIDGDGDLLVYHRDPGSEFRFGFSLPLGSDANGFVNAGDVDGDGVAELLLLDSVGRFPSPSDGLRDGFFRLRVCNLNGDELVVRSTLGASGFFPGNGSRVDLEDLDGDGRSELWWSAGGWLYRLRLEGRDILVLDRAWSDVSAGRPTLVPSSSGRPQLIYPIRPPAPGSTTMARGERFYLPAPGQPAAAPLALRASASRQGEGGVDVTLSWASRGPMVLSRQTLSPTGDPLAPRQTLDAAVSSGTYEDRGLEAGGRYVYRLRAEGSAIDADSLVIRAEPANPLVSARYEDGYLLAEWTRPLTATEGAAVRLVARNGGALLTPGPHYPTLDRGARRLLVPLPAALVTPGAATLLLSGYLSDANLPLRPEDARVDIEPVVEPRTLVLVSAVVTSDRSVRVLFAPAAPLTPGLTDITLTPPVAVAGVERVNGEEVELTLAQPLTAGAYALRLTPGVSEPGGASARSGEGDALAFRVQPMVYPNPVPATGLVRFEAVEPGARIVVFDLTGRPVWEGSSDASGAAVWSLDDSDGRVAPGVYLYRIEGFSAVSGRVAVVAR